MSRVTFATVLDPPWASMEPVRLGGVSAVRQQPDRFVLVESTEGPFLRVDLHRTADEYTYCFQEACLWSGFVVIGWGHRTHLVELRARVTMTIELGSYFGHLYPQEESLLVASAERLFRIEPDGSVLWQSEPLGIDGVLVHDVDQAVIRGSGEWDPPGGWESFRISKATGRRVE